MEKQPELREILNASSLEELKTLGKLKDIRKVVNEGFGFKVPGRGAGWKGYFARIESLKKISTLFPPISTSNGNSYSSDLFFKSETEKYLYGLTEVDGASRIKLLGIRDEFYSNSSAARNWRDHIIHLIHPDSNPHPSANKAASKLSELYENMTSDG